MTLSQAPPSRGGQSREKEGPAKGPGRCSPSRPGLSAVGAGENKEPEGAGARPRAPQEWDCPEGEGPTALPPPGCRDPEKGAGSGGDSDSQGRDAGVPRSQAAPSLSVPGVPAGARMQAGPHEGGGLGAVGSADAPEPPEKLRQRQGRTPGSPGSQRRAPLRQARAPGPKRSRGDRQRAYGPPAVSDPVRRPAPPRLGRYLSVSRAARLARHCAARRFLSRLLNGAGQRRSGPSRPDQSSGRRGGAWPAERRVIEEAPPAAGGRPLAPYRAGRRLSPSGGQGHINPCGFDSVGTQDSSSIWLTHSGFPAQWPQGSAKT
ncbi:basic salivary proline-rich protein 3-like [Zalophus californianus]|uniref:Basic salivary proline-rich protein 3-like n=1 Tax=Zalophus californianus TaxID=9704 RepID=A0A6J2DWG3_ZALCA|nr:basic salivary proline-rich protein 3-like [Zalophus californianus]